MLKSHQQERLAVSTAPAALILRLITATGLYSHDIRLHDPTSPRHVLRTYQVVLIRSHVALPPITVNLLYMLLLLLALPKRGDPQSNTCG